MRTLSQANLYFWSQSYVFTEEGRHLNCYQIFYMLSNNSHITSIQ